MLRRLKPRRTLVRAHPCKVHAVVDKFCPAVAAANIWACCWIRRSSGLTGPPAADEPDTFDAPDGPDEADEEDAGLVIVTVEPSAYVMVVVVEPSALETFWLVPDWLSSACSNC